MTSREGRGPGAGLGLRRAVAVRADAVTLSRGPCQQRGTAVLLAGHCPLLAQGSTPQRPLHALPAAPACPAARRGHGSSAHSSGRGRVACRRLSSRRATGTARPGAAPWGGTLAARLRDLPHAWCGPPRKPQPSTDTRAPRHLPGTSARLHTDRAKAAPEPEPEPEPCGGPAGPAENTPLSPNGPGGCADPEGGDRLAEHTLRPP